MVAGDELRLGLGEIEGGAVGLGVGAHQVDQEGDDLEAAEDVPGERAVCGLRVDDVAQVERAGAEDDSDEGETEG